ncbi:M56 family metallopeptidase [Archangium sp.]|jgi:beta-lactamase regulating signal transducer with metallopeptidase domain|uniref:M56 family metallopeptidase n=1 Tax=Archangium sp. TaxID=1872627 RepID=UPI002ED8B34B
MSMLEALWTQPVTLALGGALARFVWQGAAIALGVRALLACMGRRPARERYALACFGLLVMAGLPVASFGSELARTSSESSQAPGVMGGGALIGATEVALATWVGAWLEALRPWLMSAWLCGVLFLSVRTVWDWRQALALAYEGTWRPVGSVAQAALARMMKRTRVSRPVRLLESVAIEVPTVVGLWRPLILVPASTLTGLSLLQLEAVLAHELAHIRRHDYLVNLLQALVETALFYHPAVWWLSARIREEREHCADDVAVESCGDALLYSRALATLEQLRASAPVPAVAANGGSLLLRIQRLLAVPQGGTSLHPWRLAGTLAAATLLVVLGAAPLAQATGATSEPPAQQAPATSTSHEQLPRFQLDMTRPEKLSGDVPRIPNSMLPPLAPPGTFPFEIPMQVECTLTAEGLVEDCEVIVPRPELAELEAEVRRALLTARYKPVTSQGQPISVRYVFNVRIVSPQLNPKELQ